MPNLQAVLEESSFNSLDDTLKTYYTQNSETKQFYLNLPDADKIAFNLQADVKKKEDLLRKAHDEKNLWKAKAEPFEILGKTPDEIKAALESNRPEEVSRLLSEKEDKHRIALASFESTIADATSKAERYQKQLLKTAVDTHIARVRNQFDLNDVADYVLRDYYRAEEDADGRVSVKIYENGNPALKANQPLTDEQLLAQWREDKKHLAIFNAGTGEGSGAQGRQGSLTNAKTIKRAEWERMTPKESSSFFANGGSIQD